MRVRVRVRVRMRVRVSVSVSVRVRVRVRDRVSRWIVPVINSDTIHYKYSSARGGMP